MAFYPEQASLQIKLSTPQLEINVLVLQPNFTPSQSKWLPI
jgi:hypothetical protein